jgi:predicted SAM-dependent methyltransferase
MNLHNLNIGCGYNKIYGFTNIDWDPNCNPDLLLDLEKDNLPFEDNSVNSVLAHHVLDRLGDGFFHCMKELYRVCRNGATIEIQVTYPRHDNFYADPTIKRGITIEGMWLLSKKYSDSALEKGFKTKSLAYFHNIDFEIIDMSYILDPEFKITEDMDMSVLTRENNTRIQTNIKLVAVKL